MDNVTGEVTPAPTELQGRASLAKKMTAIMGDLETISHDKTHQQGYKYASAGAVANEIRKNMSRHGVAFFAGVVKIDERDDSDLITYEYTFMCSDTGHAESRLWVHKAMKKMGDRIDDKAYGKAATYAEKFFLMKTFIMSSEDDPDVDADQRPVEQQATGTNGRRVPAKPSPPPQKPLPNGNEKHDDTESTPGAGSGKVIQMPPPDNNPKIEPHTQIVMEHYGKEGKNGKRPLRIKTTTGAYSYNRQPFRDAGIDCELWEEAGLYMLGGPFHVISMWHQPKEKDAQGYWKIDRLEPMTKTEVEIFADDLPTDIANVPF